jgi:hypothetical protein
MLAAAVARASLSTYFQEGSSSALCSFTWPALAKKNAPLTLDWLNKNQSLKQVNLHDMVLAKMLH